MEQFRSSTKRGDLSGLRRLARALTDRYDVVLLSAARRHERLLRLNRIKADDQAKSSRVFLMADGGASQFESHQKLGTHVDLYPKMAAR